MSYKNNQPVSVHNKMDVENGIYYADHTRSDSDVYGDLRDSREGRGLLGDGVMYVTITGLLTTDTITAIAGSDTPTCTINDRLDIANIETVLEFYVHRASVLIGHYILEEETGFTIIQVDKSLLLGNGSIVNSSPANFVTENSVGMSYANTHGHTISDGVTYYYNNNDTGLIPINVIIPRDESSPTKCCAYLLGGAQADLQYKGKVPYQHHVTNSPCFKGVTGSYMTLDVLTTDVITAHATSSVPTCTINGRLDFVDGELYYDVTITRGGVKIARLTFIEKPANGIYRDIGVNGGVPTNNDATGVNLSPTNQGYQNQFGWLQNGCSQYSNFNGTSSCIGSNEFIDFNLNSVITIKFGIYNTSVTGIAQMILESSPTISSNAGAFYCLVRSSGELQVTYTSDTVNNYAAQTYGIIEDGTYTIVIDTTKLGTDLMIVDRDGTPLAPTVLNDNAVRNIGFTAQKIFIGARNCASLFSSLILDYIEILSKFRITNPINPIDELSRYTFTSSNIELVNIPALSDLSEDVLGNDLTIIKGGFLETEETLTLDPTPETVQADAANNVYFDALGNPIDQTFISLDTNNLVNNQYFNDLSVPNKVRQIRFHKDNLTVQQVNTDKRITNNN